MRAEDTGGAGRARARRTLLLILGLALVLRAATAPSVFRDGAVYLDGPDAYYHLHRAAQTVAGWPAVPQTDRFLDAPAGGRISWPPLFDWLLATLALPWRASPRAALEIIGALLPVLLGVVQVGVVYAIVRRLRDATAALASAAVAAVLPGVVRYTMAGVLDHDPFFELAVLLSILAIVEAATGDGEQPRPGVTALLAAALVMGTLGWAGAELQCGIVIAAALAAAIAARDRAPAVGGAVALGAGVAAVAVLPFVVGSVWTRVEGFTFEGLSWLHETALVGTALVGAAIAVVGRRPGRVARLPLAIGALAAVALVPLAPPSAGAFVRGLRYAAGDADILALVAETQPLTALFGTADPRPLLVRLGLIPVLVVVGLGIALFRHGDRRSAAILAPWVAITLALAVAHSRFTYSAALALAAASGLALAALAPRWRAAALAVALIPAIPAYVAVPGFERHSLLDRGALVQRLEIDALAGRIRASAADGAVLAPWYMGHWLVWYAERPVVLSPMLDVGQPGFAGGMRFFFLEDDGAALELLRARGVSHVVVTPELASIRPRAALAGVEARRYVAADGRVDLGAYARTVAARLTFRGAIPGLREVARSRAFVDSPYGGVVPEIRVYEVEGPAGLPATATP